MPYSFLKKKKKVMMCFMLLVLLLVASVSGSSSPSDENIMIPYVREVITVYKDDTLSKKSKRKQAKLLRLFDVTTEWMNATGVEWWIDFGTLLGWYRDGIIIPKDKDVDFGTTVEGWNKLRDNASWLSRYDCYFTDTSYKHTGPKAVIACKWWSRKSTNGADLYGYRRQDETTLRSPTYEGCKVGKSDLSLPCGSSICPQPYNYYFPVNCSDANLLHGKNVCVPNGVHKVITRYYGTVNKNAKCKKQCCVGGDDIAVKNPVDDTPPLPYWNAGSWAYKV